MTSTPFSSSVVIVGSGITALTLACTLAKDGLDVTVISDYDLSLRLNDIRTQDITDGRAYAIARGSVGILNDASIWPMIADKAGPIHHIRVSDHHSHQHLDYSHKLVSDEPMGYMLDAILIQQTAIEQTLSHSNIHIVHSAHIERIEQDEYSATLYPIGHPPIRTSLLVVADGRMSKTRTLLGIEALTHHYQQTAIVCTIKHEQHHQHVAQERFLPTGPFAVLPLKDGYHSSLVWVENSTLAKTYLALPIDECAAHIQLRIGNYLGTISLASKLNHFPLVLKQAKQYHTTRAVLAGDAAHGIHPLAGQGLNLGLRDMIDLRRLITKTTAIGGDIGASSLCITYSKTRQFDSWSMISVTHGFDKLFQSHNPLLTFVRRMGLNTVNHITPLKRLLIKHASGV